MSSTAAKSIDQLMDRASEALVRTEYFATEGLAVRALRRARQAVDFERMARICLPLQEARRQLRQFALDEGFRGVLTTLPLEPPHPGVYLVQPPLVGIDARQIRELFWSARVPALVLCREPMTRDGKWPVVAVSGPLGLGGPTDLLTVRVKVAPPPGVVSLIDTEKPGPTRDRMEGEVPVEWASRAAEELGEHALKQLDGDDPPAHRVDALLDYLDACPEHERLHQRLMDECRRAAAAPTPTRPRRGWPRADDSGW